MAAQTQSDIAHINDEDVLRKMWQETEDFGRKKEIRSHMYKLREARLREFYNSGDVSTEVHENSSKATKSFSSKQQATHHADSLLDHSFLSLKSKEIRDSASPTRDVAFNTNVNRYEDQGWNVTTCNEQSNDGKLNTTKRTATTSGTKAIDGGKIDYVAESEQKMSVYQDGDEKNFTRAVGTASSAVLEQESVGGEENRNFRSTSKTTSSTSRMVTESRSESGDGAIRNENVKITNAQPVCLDANTKVTKETKTLPDGSVVTTTKYVTDGGSNERIEKSSTRKVVTESRSEEQRRTSKNEVEMKGNQSHDVVVSETKPEIIETTTYVTKEIERDESSPIRSPVRKSPVKEAPYKQPDRRQPAKPAKSELDQKLEATEGQYDTTYRSDYTQKRVSVDVSPTHDAFARSLRSISPDRMSKCSSVSRGSLRTSNVSLRSSTSPEKMRHPSRLSPERRSVSPKKSVSRETITITTSKSPERHTVTGYSTDTITRRKKTVKEEEKFEIDGSTLTRRKNVHRSPSPTTTASDIEYIRNVNDIVTDLDVDDSNTRRQSIDKTNKKVLKRTDTYEERCKQILGLVSNTTNEISVEKTGRLNKKRTSQDGIEIVEARKSAEKQTRTSPEKQIRKSPEKERPLQKYPQRKSPEKSGPSISEFPAQIRKSPQKESLEKYPERKSTEKVAPSISEFPAQIRKSPDRLLLEKYPERKSPKKDVLTISEFPAQIRRNPERETLEKYPERKSPEKVAPSITEFPSQVKRTPEKQPMEKYPERKSPEKEGPSLSEFPAQIRKSPEKESRQPAKKGIKTEESDDTEEAKEFSKFKTVAQLENRVPVKEPVCTKRFITQLGKDEEMQRMTVTNGVADHKSVKKDLSATMKKENFTRKSSDSNIQMTKKGVKKTTKIDEDTKVTTKQTDITVKKTVDNKSKSVVTPKRHTVSTTITVTPKTIIKTNKTTISSVVDRLSKPKKPMTKLQNGHKSSDSEEERTTEVTEMKSTKNQKFNRTTSDQQMKVSHKVPVRGQSKPELFLAKKPVVEEPRKPKKLEKKCISTKSIIINNKDDSEIREVIVDLQRSTSSREPTPDRVCPRLMSSEDIDVSTPRYPDRVVEPEEFGGTYKRKKSTKLTEIPIIEGEDTTSFTSVVDVSETVKISDVDKVEETDESLLSVNKKINKFTKEQSGKTVKKSGIAPKVDRPVLIVDDNLKEDECLLSVSDKVSKFITTAEELITPQASVDRPKSPKCMYYPENEENVNVSQKVSEFTTTQKETVKKQQPAMKVARPDLTNVDESLKEDECLLSVSDKVTKFITTAEKLTTDEKNKTINLSKLDEKKVNTECVEIVDDEHMYTRTSKSPEKTPERRPSNQYKSIKESVKESDRSATLKSLDSTPKSSRTQQETFSTNRLRSTDSIKKAKAVFERQDDRELARQQDILNRPSVFDARKLNNKTPTRTRLDFDEPEERKTTRNTGKDDTLKSARLVLDRMRPKSPERFVSCRPGSPEKFEKFVGRTEEIVRRGSLRDRSPIDGEVPGYMKPLDRSVRPNSPHRASLNQLKCTEDKVEGTTTKFGVTLRRTNSGRVVSTERRRSSILEKQITDEEIEDLFDLEILELLVEKTVDYEIRRKIRAQIRLVKKLIAENTLESYIVTRRREQARKYSVDYKTVNLTERRRSTKSPDTVNRVKTSPERMSVTTKTEYQSQYTEQRSTRRSKSPETVIRAKSPQKQSPERKMVKKISENSFVGLKKTTPLKKEVVDDKPEWVKQRNLRKTSENTTTVKSSSYSTTRKETKRSSPVKEVKSTDIITSSYGVGPTDENGTPLFGLRALRSQKTTSDTKTKVQGTVIQSEYYAKNGDEPIGQISVTKYSNDPKFVGKTNGLTSVTTTQKFGYKDTPSLKSLESNSNKSLSATVTRQDSVKCLSQKFIDNAVESLKSEKQSTYPRAGLILRTSSFKDSNRSRETTPEKEEYTRTVKTARTTVSSSGETFLSNKNRVSGVQDVISRMKATDTKESDTQEDMEARSLLNKFIGSQVLLSGMESGRNLITSTPQMKTTTTTERRATKITSTVTETSKPKTLNFSRPITEKELENIWEEKVLRLLLEQSTDYEERRLIRARLRQVMAEQEACTDLVEKASVEQASGQIEGESLLLPLLQGLLQTPETDHTPDSGTESGEDQRNGLIVEVQNALDKLSNSLRSDATDITAERRTNLLQLVTKLQAGLATTLTTIPMNLERRNSSGGRFNRRKQRQNRHTVGVSSEELADARRLMEEISLQRDAVTMQTGENGIKTSIKCNPVKAAVVRNAVAKPFSCSNSTSTSSIQTPTDVSEYLEFLFNDEQTKVDEMVKESETEDESTTVQAMEPLKTNPIYTKPLEVEKLNRFNMKKMKMKRANTIDIPKPLDFNDDEDDGMESDSSLPDDAQRRRNTYYALRGPIRVGHQTMNGNNKVPMFEPKTESDKKFMAFINKHNNSDGEHQKNTMWQTGRPAANRTPVWGNKFGHLKSTFEPASNGNSAREFWKTTEDAGVRGNKFGPKISKHNGRNLQQMFEDKQKPIREQQQSKLPWTETSPQKIQIATFVPVNKFTHAPQSAFKPIQSRNMQNESSINKENTVSERQPLFLYSPKPMNESPNNLVTSKPWTATTSGGERRVKSLAAEKFEPPPVVMQPIKQQSKVFPQPSLNAPFLVKSVADNNKPMEFSSQTSVKYIAPVKQYYQHVPGQEINNEYSQQLTVQLKPQPKTFPNHSYTPQDYQFGNKQPPKVEINREKKPLNSHSYNPQHYQFLPKTETKVIPKRDEKIVQQIKESPVDESPIEDGEYLAVSSKVMSSPVSQMATTVRQKSPMTRDEHDIEAAFNLRNTLQRVSKSGSTSPATQRSQTFTFTKQERDQPPTRTYGVVKPILQQKPIESLEMNESGESIVTSQFKIPVINVPKEERIDLQQQRLNVLSKSDSWHQICLQPQHKPLPRSSPNVRPPPPLPMMKSKSSHSLAVTPKQFQAGMTREESALKKRTMEAYLQPKCDEKSYKRTSINRIKTTDKMSAVSNNNGLARSRTLPDFCPEFIDESDVDQAFEDLFKRKQTTTTKQIITKGPVTTEITSVTTTTKKPMSPFAKFRQLDKQNSLNTPPSTPNTPSGSGPLFKFTDPALSQSASTIKDRLLYWCRMKTKEYENIQLDNFSTSWADGLAFCALIHHFLPDSFDYHALTPKNRRHNFTLAFQVADEKADIAPLLDVDDMVATRKPDWKCVFTYVQSIYRRFKDED